MDPLVQIILSTGTVVAAAAVALFIGSRKGLADMEARSDAEMHRLVEALEGRVRVLTDELDAANRRIELLQAEVDSLRRDLEVERRATERLKRARPR